MEILLTLTVKRFKRYIAVCSVCIPTNTFQIQQRYMMK